VPQSRARDDYIPDAVKRKSWAHSNPGRSSSSQSPSRRCFQSHCDVLFSGAFLLPSSGNKRFQRSERPYVRRRPSQDQNDTRLRLLASSVPMSEKDKHPEKTRKSHRWANDAFPNGVAILPPYCEYITQLFMAFYVLANWSHYSLQRILIYPDGIGTSTSPCRPILAPVALLLL